MLNCKLHHKVWRFLDFTLWNFKFWILLLKVTFRLHQYSLNQYFLVSVTSIYHIHLICPIKWCHLTSHSTSLKYHQNPFKNKKYYLTKFSKNFKNYINWKRKKQQKHIENYNKNKTKNKTKKLKIRIRNKPFPKKIQTQKFQQSEITHNKNPTKQNHPNSNNHQTQKKPSDPHQSFELTNPSKKNY